MLVQQAEDIVEGIPIDSKRMATPCKIHSVGSLGHDKENHDKQSLQRTRGRSMSFERKRPSPATRERRRRLWAKIDLDRTDEGGRLKIFKPRSCLTSKCDLQFRGPSDNGFDKPLCMIAEDTVHFFKTGTVISL